MSSVSLQMEEIHKKDTFICDLAENRVSHVRPDLEEDDRGPVIGYYAVAQVEGGGRILKVRSRKEVEAHAKRYSKCYDRKKGVFMEDTPWATEFDQMGKKTVLIQVMKLLPKSVEIQHAISMDETVKSKLAIDMIEIPNEAPIQPEPDDKEEAPDQTSLTSPEQDKIDPNNLPKPEFK